MFLTIFLFALFLKQSRVVDIPYYLAYISMEKVYVAEMYEKMCIFFKKLKSYNSFKKTD